MLTSVTLNIDSDVMDRFTQATDKLHGGKVFGAKSAEIRKALENHIKLMEEQKK